MNMIRASLAFCGLAVLAACSNTPTTEQNAAAVESRTLSSGTPGSTGASGTTNAVDGNALPSNTVASVNAQNTTPSTGGPTSSLGAGGTPTGLSREALAQLRDPNGLLYKRSIYYDYDSFTVSDQFRAMVEAHARFLNANKGARIRVEGNTDERGSREYNLALGGKRSDSVKRMMTLMGVQEAQIETVSFGEEKPRAQGSSETAYAENRRCDIYYVGE